MVHTFKMFDKYIALDVNSGCVHDMDKLSYDIINFLNVKNFAPTSSEAKFKLIDDLKYDYDRGEISDARDIRMAALANRVTYYTTIAGGRAAVEGIKHLSDAQVCSLQEMYAEATKA